MEHITNIPQKGSEGNLYRPMHATTVQRTPPSDTVPHEDPRRLRRDGTSHASKIRCMRANSSVAHVARGGRWAGEEIRGSPRWGGSDQRWRLRMCSGCFAADGPARFPQFSDVWSLTRRPKVAGGDRSAARGRPLYPDTTDGTASPDCRETARGGAARVNVGTYGSPIGRVWDRKT